MTESERAERMPSPEGKARRAWNAYAKAVNKVAVPALGPAFKPVARELTFELMGFWLAWHLEGGYEGLSDPNRLGMSRSAIYRRITLFRRILGAHPDDYVMPGVATSVTDYLANRPYQHGAADTQNSGEMVP